ncbi:hypothetical protein BCV72DRAFT_338596 [Rhizopus microsporus var. microsporus]|uniref:Uncharacterized protein n=2 Tax=Rhizopus microsporus TaxID=58291 RepID=A0A2G4SK06_RHIZD|nr:uncharacterized protein RHIMIDRAFT_294623 [Rhizopus microsporus ATCC 52813]ORE02608.1 hypothetical protein BCV72DRAFT_338596 [Rhizopus microsporus var. microsporus]PHZ09104.1 hypothetical protein RHIMIDRAFT_294623 [Rhizopus microsporus ATCC 52813]
MNWVKKWTATDMNYLENCIFVDESGFNINMRSLSGWSLKGKPAVAATVTGDYLRFLEKTMDEMDYFPELKGYYIDSLQSIASSLALKAGIPKDDNITMSNWFSSAVFENHYRREHLSQFDFSNTLIDIDNATDEDDDQFFDVEDNMTCN